jgi:hypothetical protein
LGSVTYCDLSIVLVDGSKETQMNLAGHLGILSAKNSTDQTWRGTRRGEKEVVELACGAAQDGLALRAGGICFESS